MKSQLLLPYLLVAFICISCSNDSDGTPVMEVKGMYFPPINSDVWETISIAELNWNEVAGQPLYDFLEENNTDFIILKNGRIVTEKYFGDFNAETNHSWNPAAKTLTAFDAGLWIRISALVD